MKRYALLGAFVLLAGAASAETVGEKTGINSTLGIAPTTADFVHEAAISDMFEIQSSQLALDKLNGQEKNFADQMIKDHTKTSSELKGLATEAHVDVPGAMDESHQNMLEKLKALSGDDFRKMYFSDQVSGHKDAVSLFERYGKGGENAKIKDWASTTLPALQHHLSMAQDDYKNT
jgi:putative membrane protein